MTKNEDTYIFKVGVDLAMSMNLESSNNFLVDCGATTHVVNDISKFIECDDHFNSNNHVIELADGSKQTKIVKARGTAEVILQDNSGVFVYIRIYLRVYYKCI